MGRSLSLFLFAKLVRAEQAPRAAQCGVPALALAQGVLGSTTQPGRAGRHVAEGRVHSPLLLAAGIQLLPSSNQE